MLHFLQQVWQSLLEEVEKLTGFNSFRYAKEWTFLIGMFVLLVYCQSGKITYAKTMEKCMEEVEVSEFVLESGEKGKAYRNFDINCLMGAQLPFFTTYTLDGKEISTEDLHGHINVFNFWFAACKPCLAEIPGLNLIAEKYEARKVNFFALSIDDEDTLRKLLNKQDFKFIHLLKGKEIIRESFQHKSGFPTTIVTDKNLQIIEIISGRKLDATTVGKAVVELDTFLETLVD